MRRRVHRAEQATARVGDDDRRWNPRAAIQPAAKFFVSDAFVSELEGAALGGARVANAQDVVAAAGLKRDTRSPAP
jgi:hypothetical protein